MKRLALIAVGVVGAMTLTSCGFGGIYSVPLPGGADVGDHPYTVKAEFRDVLDLVPKSGVKVNEVPVGRVDAIGLSPDGWHAQVTMSINGDVKLPANALANIRQSSLLGEKYVELTSPGQDLAQGQLANNADIPLERTNRSVDVEEVLGALSMLLNGGGVQQLNTITRELNSATDGREPDIRNLLQNANDLVKTLDQQSSDITRALDGLNRLSSTLVSQKDQLAHAIDNLGPGLQVLSQQRGQLVTMLQALQRLSGVTVDTINKSQGDLVEDLRALLPTLQKLGEAGSDLPKSLQVLLTFPFTDSALDGAKGDYFNLYADIDLNLKTIMDNLGRSRDNPLSGILPSNLGLTGGSPSNSGSSSALPFGTSGTNAPAPSGTGGGAPPQPGLGNLFGLLGG